MRSPQPLYSTSKLSDATDAAVAAVQAGRLDYETALAACVDALTAAEVDQIRRIAGVVAIVEALSAAAVRKAVRDTDPEVMQAALAAGRFDPWIGRAKRCAILAEIGGPDANQLKENAYAERC